MASPRSSDSDKGELTSVSLRALKRLVRYMHKHDLRDGDRLPPQAQLCRELGTNNDALSPAMRWLTERGAITRKSRAGTVLCRRQSIGPLPWVVGVANIAAPPTGPNAIFTLLEHHLKVAFARQGWSSRSYYRLEPRRNPPAASLPEFTGLIEDIHADQLDALVLMTICSSQAWLESAGAGVPCCHTPFWETAPCGVVIDQFNLAEQATVLLAKQGRRSLAAIASAKPDRWLGRYAQGFNRGLSLAGLPQGAGQLIEAGQGIEGGHHAARQILAMPRQRRPDGFLVMDDFIALGLCDRLRESDPSYRPLIAAQTCAQLPLAFRLPVIRFDLDLTELAATTMRLVEQKLLNPGCIDRIDWIQPLQAHEQARNSALAVSD